MTTDPGGWTRGSDGADHFSGVAPENDWFTDPRLYNAVANWYWHGVFEHKQQDPQCNMKNPVVQKALAGHGL